MSAQSSSYFDREYFELHTGKARYLEYLIGLLSRNGIGGGKVLDVGSGYGFLLEALNRAGYDPSGIEVSEYAAAASRRRVAVPVQVQGAEEPFPYPDEEFVAITMLDVIEHLEDFGTTLAECRRTLCGGGLLVIITLNGRSVLHWLLGRGWSWYQDPTHKWMFTRPMLESALRSSGFSHPRMRTIFNLHVAGETTKFLSPLRRLGGVVTVPGFGDSLLAIARKGGPQEVNCRGE